MVINQKKTLIMSVNTKLVGIVVSDDLKWDKHVDYMCKRASGRSEE